MEGNSRSKSCSGDEGADEDISYDQFVEPEDSENVEGENTGAIEFPVNVVPDDMPMPSGDARGRDEDDARQQSLKEIE